MTRSTPATPSPAGTDVSRSARLAAPFLDDGSATQLGRSPVDGAPSMTATATKASAVRHAVVIADPDPLARRAIRDVLQDGTPFVVAAEASDGIEAVELALHYRPDIVLAEASLPRVDGLAAVQQIRQAMPEVRIVMFSVLDDLDLQMDAVRAGAIGYVSKNTGIASAVTAMEAVMRGESAVSPALATRLVERIREVPDAGIGLRPVRSPLTTREWEVLDLLSTGATTREIAEQFFLADSTIDSHIKNVMRKLGVNTRRAAVDAAQALMQPETHRGAELASARLRAPGA